MDGILKSVFPLSTEANRAKYNKSLVLAMLKYNIDTPNRKRAFLAQVGHESGQLSAVSENLNYSASALRRVFGKYFPDDIAANEYARKPEMIANKVYANRMGNGDEASGDGWKYRGRGLIQITGKNNYEDLNVDMLGRNPGINLLQNPDLLATPEYAALSAAWFWKKSGLNELADKLGGSDDHEVFKHITRRINGGYNGLADRVELYENAKRYIVT